MVDDFHGTEAWDTFVASIRKVLPDPAVVELANNDPIFGAHCFDTGKTYEKDGYQPGWLTVSR